MKRPENTTASGVHDPMRYARATHRMARVITSDFDAATIRAAMVEIIGETLDVDRTFIYDIRFDDQVAEGLCEWINPDTEGLQPANATYPLAVFGSAAELIRQTRCRLESYASEVHPAIAADGSAVHLHQELNIASLLWFPFDFEAERYHVLVFNQVRHERRWSPEDLAFVESVAELVSTAQLRIRLEAERLAVARKEQQRARLAGLGLLARGVAHDFNNLLTAILANSTALQRRVVADGDDALMVESITEAAQSAAAMCQRLLTYAGEEPSELERIDLNALVESVLSALSAPLAVPVVRQLASRPVWVMGGAAELSQLLLNLVTNASQASAAGGTPVTVRTGLRSRGAEGRAPFLEVVDEGRGMDSETKARMFDAYFTTKPGGHGLGLASVYAALAHHDATIAVESELGRGTSVRVTFPAPDGDGLALGAQRRALLVDADRTVQQLCASALALEGYRVVSVSTGDAALARCTEPGAEFDLVVMDLELGGKDGRRVFEAMREAGVKAPVLFVGGLAIGEAFEQAGHRGWAFLKKPFTPVRLLEVAAEVQETPAS